MFVWKDENSIPDCHRSKVPQGLLEGIVDGSLKSFICFDENGHSLACCLFHHGVSRRGIICRIVWSCAFSNEISDECWAKLLEFFEQFAKKNKIVSLDFYYRENDPTLDHPFLTYLDNQNTKWDPLGLTWIKGHLSVQK